MSQRFSPHRNESEQKDLIISQLKAEIFELRQGDSDYHDLSSQLRNLEHRYGLLQEEKLRNESDYKNRNDTNLRMIANLKTDVDTLKSSIEENNIDYQENKAENLAIKDIADHRAADISKLKNELAGSIDQNNRNKEAKRDLDGQLALARDEKRKLLGQNDGSRANKDELVYRTGELDKIVRELEYDRNRAEKQQQQLQHNNDNLNLELRSKTDNLRNIEQQINDADRHIQGLEGDVKELERSNEKARAEVIAQQRGHQQEVSKNLELSAKINNHENVLRTREIQIDDYKKDIDQLNQAHRNQNETLHQSNEDLQALQRQIDALTDTNNQLVGELEEFSRQDEQVRGVLNRKSKVNDLIEKSESQVRQSPLKGSDLRGSSPGRKQNNKPGNSNRRSPY